MKQLFLILIVATSGFLFTDCQRKSTNTATSSVNTATTAQLNQQIEAQNGKPMLVGKINRMGLQTAPFNAWFDSGYKNYTVDAASLAPVKDKLKNTEVLLFMGTWCGDSQREVPHFFKILDNAGYAEKNLQLVAVDNHPDRYKQSPQHEEKGWNIQYVPTIILLQGGKEVGRIVETPQETLEKDLAKILNK